MRGCIGFCVLFLCGLPVTVHADEAGAVAADPSSSEPASLSDALGARLESEVLRYYSGIGAEPTKKELSSALSAARDMLLADVSIIALSAAVTEAIQRHEGAEMVPFTVAVPRLVRALAEQADARQSKASELALKQARRFGVELAREASRQSRKRSPKEVARDRKKGTGLMAAAFVAQGFSFGATFASVFSGEIMWGSWAVQALAIPFAPMGVAGFSLRYGGSNKTERLRWSGVGLLQGAAFAGLVGFVNLAALYSPNYGSWDFEGPGLIGVPGTLSHFGTSLAFVIAGAICVEVARVRALRQEVSQSQRFPARAAGRGFVLPTIEPRPGGVSLGLVAVF